MKKKNLLLATLILAIVVLVNLISKGQEKSSGSYLSNNLEALSHAQESSSQGGYTIERHKCKDSYKEQIVCKRNGNDECQQADCFF